MTVIERSPKALARLTDAEKAVAAVILASGHGAGAYYDQEGNRLCSVTLHADQADQAMPERMAFSLSDSRHLPVYDSLGHIKGFIALAEGANLPVAQSDWAHKRKIANSVAYAYAGYLPPDDRIMQGFFRSHREEFIQRLLTFSEQALADHPDQGRPHPERLHGDGVAELVHLGIQAVNRSDMGVTIPESSGNAIWRAYRIHDIAKQCSLPLGSLRPHVNQAYAADSAERRYFDARNASHPVDLLILLPFQPELALVTALHHGTLYSHRKPYADVAPEEVPFVAKLGRVMDVLCAMTSQRGQRSGMSMEKALNLLCERAIASYEAAPREDRTDPNIHLFKAMLEQGVFTSYAGRHPMARAGDKFRGGVTVLQRDERDQAEEVLKSPHAQETALAELAKCQKALLKKLPPLMNHPLPLLTDADSRMGLKGKFQANLEQQRHGRVAFPGR